MEHLCHTRHVKLRVGKLVLHQLIEFRHECTVLWRERILLQCLDVSCLTEDILDLLTILKL